MTTTLLTGTDTADITLKAKHRAMWAAGDYATVADDLVWRLGPELVRAAAVRPGQRVLDVAAGSGNAAIPAALAGPRRRQRPDPGAVRRRPARGRAGRRRAHLGAGGRRGAAVRRRVVRHRALLPRRDVRAAPPAGGRRAGPGLPPRGQHRSAQLDAGGLHRPDVRDHEAVRRPAGARSPAGAALGRRAARPRLARRPGRPRDDHEAVGHVRRLRHRPSSATTSRPTTAPRSRRTTSTSSTPSASGRSTSRWRTSPTRRSSPVAGAS